MIYILKNPEPNCFTQFRLTANASYTDMPSTVKDALKKSLLEEQGYLCAYCMSRISSKNMKIEHFHPQSIFPSKVLEYSNLLAVCKGNEGECSQMQTCDTKKSDQIITINPLIQNHVDDITYYRDGTIISKFHQNELDIILNLNISVLKSNRKNVLKYFLQEISKKKKDKSLTKSTLKKLLTKYECAQLKNEYDGIVISYLKKKVKKI